MKSANEENRYKKEDGKHLIEVRVKSAQQLFDARDPAPFRERDLDDDFVEYIVSAVREFSLSVPLKIVIYVGEAESHELRMDSIIEAIKSYFNYQKELHRSELKNFIRRSQVYFAIGLVALFGCLGLAQSIQVPNPPGILGVLREGIVIFGWVSIWKPIELILFDWYPIYEKLKFYRKLKDMEIEIQFKT